jgi:signal transduction histidine kinase
MEALRTGRQVNGVTMGVFHPDEHEYHWILVDAVPEFLPGETRPYRVYATFTDLTDRRRAEEDLRRRTQGLSALLEVSKGLAATLDLGTVLQATTDGISHLFGIGTAAVYLLKGDMLRLEATTPPLPPQFPAELRNAPLADHPHISRAITSRMPVLIPDMVTAVLTPAERAVMEQRGLRTVLYLPLVAGVKALGMLIVGSVAEPRSIPEPDIDLFRTLSNLAALAVENARLYTSGQQYAADLEQEITGRRKAEQERLEMERRLLHAQKLESLGILAGGIAHDFNNLLMAVLGNLDLALRKLSPVSPARLNIEHSAQAASRAADLTRQMLAYSGKGSFVVKPMDLSELVEENAHLFRSSVARTTELRVRLDRSVPAIDADAGQVQQVIMNLITNASEAIGDGMGMITLATGVQDCDSQCLKRSRIEDVPDAGRFVYLEVSDNGCGMDEQTLQRLFDPFFTTKAMGRGLGMSAILGIVRGHRGAIFVESTAGSGSTIRVLFPVSQRTLAVNDGPAGETAREAAESVAGGTVLVVDDEEIVRNVCKEMVESFGLTVLTAVDGRDAVEVFTKHADAISLILLDLSMPNMDGMTAFKELTRIKPGAKVLLCSGFDEQDSLQHFSGEELAGFIQKPYSLKNLREALAKAGLIGE